MELAFTLLLALGILLIIFGYLGFVFAGFRHHFVTGLISSLPILNIVTLPALWSKARRKAIITLLGIVIVTASWFLGANTGINKYTGLFNNNKQSTPVTITTPSIGNVIKAPNSPPSVITTSQPIDESNLLQLPKKALYRMSFEVIPVDKIESLKGRIVKIITTNNKQVEGRITSISASSIIVNNNELPIANIKKISLMVKKAG